MKKQIYRLVLPLLCALSIQLSGQGTFTVSLRVFLEGPFSGTQMNAGLNAAGYLPLAQPYNEAPWNYQGIEMVPFIPNADVVDWVLVELRETAGDASTAYKDNVVATQAGFILKNGNIVSIDGNSPLQFSFAVTYKIYAVVYHRNHLAVMSGNELINSGGNYAYDFTTGAGQAYGGANAHKEIISGIWGMIAGDGDANGQVNNTDKNDVWKPQSGSSGYKSGDFSLNGQVDNVDKNDLWRVNSGRSSQVVGAWSCNNPFTDFRDGQVYTSVQIGTQCWMKQNLNIGTMIPGISNPSNNGIIEKYCYGDYAPNCNVYGGLYLWEEMMQYVTTPGVKGICPNEWHLPDDNEFCILAQSVDPTVDCGIVGFSGTDAGTKMKSTTGWYGGGNGTNTSGFTALPGGYREFNGNFNHSGYYANFWTSTGDYAHAWRWNLYHEETRIYRGNNELILGFSVRCMKDLPNLPPAIPSNPDPSNNSVNLPMITFLSWSCSDPENDPLWYQVYFGTTYPPALHGTAVFDTVYNPGPLDYDTTYYWKIVAHDDHGHTTEGPVWSFTTKAGWGCNDPLLDIRDYQIYNTIQIGTQCWMKQNLNVGYMISGTNNQTNNGLMEKYCYHDSISNCDVYGGLYMWEEMMQYETTPGVKGICPDGWHLPEDDEYCTLAQTVDPTVDCGITGWSGTDAGTKMKSTAGWYGGGNGTNTSGFTALPGGYRDPGYGGYYQHKYYYINLWTSSLNGSDGWRWNMYHGESRIYRGYNPANFGFSVRCIKDLPNLPPAIPSNPDPPDNSVNLPMITLLSWSCSDPENDPLLFQVYFGTTYPPPPYGSAGFDTVYNPGPLDYDTTYYWKIVAHDDHGHTTEGPVWSFSTKTGWGCNDPLLDIRDYQTYNTVQIGSQCWMAENLNIGYRINGNDEQTDNGIIERYCYHDSIENCDVYGGLYQWKEMMQYVTEPGSKGICPDGWHLSTDDEWCTLEQFVDPTIDCSSTGWRGIDGGGKLKETGLLHWQAPNTGATNSSGFTALPGGNRLDIANFVNIKKFSIFWTSSGVLASSEAWFRDLGYNSAQVYRKYVFWFQGYSVRCIKDVPNLPPAQPSNPDPPDNAANLPTITLLHWSCSDPENDPLWYEVYFGTTNPPGILGTFVTDTTYNPGPLEYNTTYYWKIVAYDDHGNMTEGPVWTFTTKQGWECNDWLLDLRDNKSYSTVQIGSQCWMAENLNIGTMINGTSTQTNNSVLEKYCYNDSTENCDVYGGLYQWNEMMQYQTVPGMKGICPYEWHLPTEDEYCSLAQYLDLTVTCGLTGWSGTDAGIKMKSTTGWFGGGNGTNTSGFTALPAGYRDYAYYFNHLAYYANFWTSTEAGSDAWRWNLSYAEPGIYQADDIKLHGFSVRCVLNTTNLPPTEPADPIPSDYSMNQQAIIELSWTCSDPEEDPLTFDVYFSTSDPPVLVASGHGSNKYNPGALQYNTTYYWRIVAFDNHGNSTPGPVWVFFTKSSWQCNDLLLDTRDNQVYSTAQIGPQCWMTDNMNIGNMITGVSNQTNNGVIEKYCSYDNPAFCATSGGLYQWDEMMQYVTISGTVGICPDGWHLPSDGEYCILKQFIDPTVNCGSTGWSGTDVGTKMKATTGWFGGGNGTNTSGFSAIPGGCRLSDGSFLIPTLSAYLWTSSASYSYAWYHNLDWNHPDIHRYDDTRYRGHSVRCVRDFQCGDPLIDARDNQTYNTVQAGTQCWMAENLNTGITVPGITEQTNNGQIEKYCYDNNPSNCTVYGALYQWNEAMNYITTPGAMGICPSGWHLPTDEEWCTLEQFLDMSITCSSTGWRGVDGGGKLKETGTAHWAPPNTGATNSSGFTGLPGGGRLYPTGNFSGLTTIGHFWSSSENSTSTAWRRGLNNTSAMIWRSYYGKTYGYSVRCLRD